MLRRDGSELSSWQGAQLLTTSRRYSWPRHAPQGWPAPEHGPVSPPHGQDLLGAGSFVIIRAGGAQMCTALPVYGERSLP